MCAYHYCVFTFADTHACARLYVRVLAFLYTHVCLFGCDCGHQTEPVVVSYIVSSRVFLLLLQNESPHRQSLRRNHRQRRRLCLQK